MHISVRLVPNSVTLNDFERRNINLYPLRHFTEFGSFRAADYVKVGWRYTDTFCDINVDQGIEFLAIGLYIIYGDTMQWITTNESVKVRHSPLASENLTNNQP